MMEMSSQLLAEEPTLVSGSRLCWSVPLALTIPGRGNLGHVGEILVDVNTGEVLTTVDEMERMIQHGKHLARRSAP